MRKKVKISLVSATTLEIAPLLVFLNKNYKSISPTIFEGSFGQIELVITGIGLHQSTWALARYFQKNRPELAIQAGIAGALDPQLHLGDVVGVASDIFADCGVEEADGSFSDAFDMGFMDENTPPFVHKRLYNMQFSEFDFLPKIHGITVNKVTGSASSIDAIQSKYPFAQIETMESAPFFYAALAENIPFLGIRSISNRVEPRNRAAWELEKAVDNLNSVLVALIDGLKE